MTIWDFLATSQGIELLHATILLISTTAALVGAYAAAKAREAHGAVTEIQRQLNGDRVSSSIDKHLDSGNDDEHGRE